MLAWVVGYSSLGYFLLLWGMHFPVVSACVFLSCVTSMGGGHVCNIYEHLSGFCDCPPHLTVCIKKTVITKNVIPVSSNPT